MLVTCRNCYLYHIVVTIVAILAIATCRKIKEIAFQKYNWTLAFYKRRLHEKP